MIKREMYLKKIRPFYDSEMIKVLTGIRRCGKSTLLLQIIEELKNNGIKEENIIYINLEDFKNQSLYNSKNLYEYLNDKLSKDLKTYILIDEIQNVDKFELVINSFRAVENTSIFITGSNSKLLSGELATHLSGRTISFNILTFNFKEFCEFKNEDKIVNYDDLLIEYMKWGGFPLVNKSDEMSKEVVLSNIFDTVVLKDIVYRNNLKSNIGLQKIIEYLIASTGKIISVKNISNTLKSKGLNISMNSVYDYIKYIIDANICDKVSRYDIRGKNVLAFEEKIYVKDLGLFKLKKNRISDESGAIVETIIYNELIARGYKVYIGKVVNGEIDFVAEKNSNKLYIQACYMIIDSKVEKREFGAYSSVKDNYPKYVISMDKMTSDLDGIRHLNLINFLLDEKLIL